MGRIHHQPCSCLSSVAVGQIEVADIAALKRNAMRQLPETEALQCRLRFFRRMESVARQIDFRMRAGSVEIGQRENDATRLDRRNRAPLFRTCRCLPASVSRPVPVAPRHRSRYLAAAMACSATSGVRLPGHPILSVVLARIWPRTSSQIANPISAKVATARRAITAAPRAATWGKWNAWTLAAR